MSLAIWPCAGFDAQVKALHAAAAERVFRETASDPKTDCANSAAPMPALGKGDVLLVARLDRLARSTRDLLRTLEGITKAGRDSARSPTHGRAPGSRRADLC